MVLAQPIADAIKLILKEIIIPTTSNRYLIYHCSYFNFGAGFSSLGRGSFCSRLGIIECECRGIIFICNDFIRNLWNFVAGWASNSKYAFFGALRSAAQMISYEIALGFALVGVLIASGTMNLSQIVLRQAGGFWHWYWLPLLPLFIVYWIAGVAETNRAPFDVAEGESEIVAGFHVEYSGMGFALFFLAEYANMLLVSATAVLLFLGGWLSPVQGIPVLELYFLAVPGIIWFLAKMSYFYFSLFLDACYFSTLSI